MSSVYKKGRDGYYYYQTYVKNNKSGKKDKRIFHALKTKDLRLAKEKKIEYDKLYKASKRFNLFKINYSLVATSLVSSFLTFILTLIYYNKTDLNQGQNNLVEENMVSIKKADITKNYNDVNKADTVIFELKKIHHKNKNNNSEEIKKTVLPNYTIELVEKLSGVFEQGKIHVTVDNESNSNDLKQLSIIIKEKHPMFSNIIICFYSNTKIGRILAKGLKDGVNNKEQQAAWLAMYTYNPVEGEYFDDNPSGYLGAN